jgi:hypothetical protein
MRTTVLEGKGLEVRAAADDADGDLVRYAVPQRLEIHDAEVVPYHLLPVLGDCERYY